jgi:hypothetical protein
MLDIKAKSNKPIIIIYCHFNPLHSLSTLEFFKYQIDSIYIAYNNDTILVFDINLDWNRNGDLNYRFKNYFNYKEERMEEHNLIEMVNFPTWSKVVNNVLKESTIDHIYTAKANSIIEMTSIKPFFGDHFIVMFDITLEKPASVTCLRRSWQYYTKERLVGMLNNIDWSVEADIVQATWDSFENNLSNVVNILIPETE